MKKSHSLIQIFQILINSDLENNLFKKYQKIVKNNYFSER